MPPKLITKTEFATKLWRRPAGFAHAVKDTMAPLVVHELARAAMNLPVGFMLSEGKATPVAVLGIPPGQNLLVSPEGQWRIGYIPAIYRSYPFSLIQSKKGQQALCVDPDSGLINETEGERFFAEDGEPVEAVKQIFNFLVQVQGNRQLTDRICAILYQYELIEPWPILLKAPEGDKALKGLYRISEKQLNQLDDEKFLELRKIGALPLIYCQLLSMQHLPNLVRLADQRPPESKPGPGALPDIDKLFGQDDDLFHFD